MKFWISTILWFLSQSIKAQVVTETLSEKLLSEELVYWKAPNDSERAASLLNKAELYKTEGLYHAALRELERAEKLNVTGTGKVSLNYSRMLNYFLADEFTDAAGIELSRLQTESISRTKEYNIMHLQSLNESEKWEACRKELKEYAEGDSLFIKSLDLLPVSYHYIDPDYCRRLSGVLPGLGQAVAGYPIKGVTSFLIQSSLVAFMGFSFYNGYYFLGGVSGGLPLLKFYSGGKRFSAILAEEQNRKSSDILKARYFEAIKSAVK